MENPWLALPHQPPYLLAQDKEAIENFNAGLTTKTQDHKIYTSLLPEPYFGDPSKASVIFLNLNPGYNPEEDEKFYADASRQQICRDNLEHNGSQYPFVLLRPELQHFSGPRWWRRKLKRLINAVNNDQLLAQKICCIEYFPYHSPKFGAGDLYLHSQSYSVQLVRQAITNHKLIVVIRAWNYWRSAIPELESYQRKFHLKVPQGAWITPKNILDNGFDAILHAISPLT